MITRQTPLKKALELGSICQRKNNCCKHGSGCLAGDDLRNISLFLGISEDKLKENYLEEVEKFNTRLLRPKTIKKGKPYGACVFFDENSCKINQVKPLECRIGNCSKYGQKLSIWFMLNYQVNPDNPESIRQYAIYLKTHPTIPGGKLREIVPDKERLKAILEFKLLN